MLYLQDNSIYVRVYTYTVLCCIQDISIYIICVYTHTILHLLCTFVCVHTFEGVGVCLCASVEVRTIFFHFPGIS